MSIGFLKRLLLLLNLTAVLVIAGAAYGFVDHRGAMQEAFHAPDFAIPTLRPPGNNIRIQEIGRPLGLFPKPVEPTKPVEDDQPVEQIESVLAKLGSVKAAIVAYEPYDEIRPAIIFELKGQGGKKRTIHVGEALETKDHPKYGSVVQVPVHYLFVRCEPDPENPDWTYFVFDMNCDGKDIQKAHWKGEGEENKANPVTQPTEPEAAASSNFYKRGAFLIGEPEKEPAKPEVKPAEPDKPAEETTVPVEPEPFTDRPATLFEEDSAGSLALTDDGLDYLRDNYENVLKDTRTRTYTDPKTKRPAGVRIVAIRNGSVANDFGILRDDIIISINDHPVTRQSQAVEIVKSELNKKNVRYIRVKLMRQGRELEKRFDSRDSATRAKAREAFRDRR